MSELKYKSTEGGKLIVKSGSSSEKSKWGELSIYRDSIEFVKSERGYRGETEYMSLSYDEVKNAEVSGALVPKLSIHCRGGKTYVFKGSSGIGASDKLQELAAFIEMRAGKS